MNGMTKPKPALAPPALSMIAKGLATLRRKPATPAIINTALVIVPRDLFGTVRAGCASVMGSIGAP